MPKRIKKQGKPQKDLPIAQKKLPIPGTGNPRLTRSMKAKLAKVADEKAKETTPSMSPISPLQVPATSASPLPTDSGSENSGSRSSSPISPPPLSMRGYAVPSMPPPPPAAPLMLPPASPPPSAFFGEGEGFESEFGIIPPSPSEAQQAAAAEWLTAQTSEFLEFCRAQLGTPPLDTPQTPSAQSQSRDGFSSPRFSPAVGVGAGESDLPFSPPFAGAGSPSTGWGLETWETEPALDWAGGYPPDLAPEAERSMLLFPAPALLPPPPPVVLQAAPFSPARTPSFPPPRAPLGPTPSLLLSSPVPTPAAQHRLQSPPTSPASHLTPGHSLLATPDTVSRHSDPVSPSGSWATRPFTEPAPRSAAGSATPQTPRNRLMER